MDVRCAVRLVRRVEAAGLTLTGCRRSRPGGGRRRRDVDVGMELEGPSGRVDGTGLEVGTTVAAAATGR